MNRPRPIPLRALSTISALLVAAAGAPGCNGSSSVDAGSRDLRAAPGTDLGFEDDPDLSVVEDLAEPEDLTLPPDLRPVALSISFAAPVGYATEMIPDGIVAADFNRDNRLDLAVTTHYGDGLAVLLGVGNGTFAAPVGYAVGSGGYGVAAGDFNGDGKMDLCVTCASAMWVRMLTGKGDGTFLAGDKYAAPQQPYGVAAGDWNGDKKLDVAAVQHGINASVLAYPGNGDGSLGAYREELNSSQGHHLAAADMDGDGILDLVTPDLNHTVLVLRGDGKGGFSDYARYEAGDGAYGVAIGDLNGDGKKDVVISNNTGTPALVRVLLGMGQGYLKPAFPYPTLGKQNYDLTLGDFDNDLLLDVAVLDTGNGTVVFLHGLGDGQLGPPLTFPCGAGPRSLATGDFNRDGKLDLAISASIDNRVSILLNTSR